MAHILNDDPGTPHVYAEGVRVRTSLLPRQIPGLWLPDGSTDQEVGQAKAALMRGNVA